MLKQRKLTQAQFIAYAGVLSALAIVLIFVEIPYPLSAYLKLDFSEVITLIAVSINFWLAIAIAIVKALITFLLKPGAPFIGHVAMLVGSVSIALTYYLSHKKLGVISSLIITSIVFCITMGLSNFFFIDPFYAGVSFTEMMASQGGFGGYITYNLVTYLPFNIMKMILVSIVFYFLQGRLNKGN